VTRILRPPMNLGLYDGPLEINWSSPQAEGLVAAWTFSQSRDGLFLRDLVGNNHGTLGGTLAWKHVPEHGGYGLTFDGSTTSVAVPHSDALALVGKPFTLSVWAVMGTGSNRVILGKPFAATHTNPYLEWGLYRDTTLRRIEFRVNAEVLDGGSGTKDGALYHIVATADGSYWRKYLNGVLNDSVARVSLPLNRNSRPVYFGRNAAGSEDFDGTILSATVHEAALSADVVWQMYDPATRWDLYRPLRQVWVVHAQGGGPITGTAALSATRSDCGDGQLHAPRHHGNGCP
jgi:hypothetical protein